MPELLHAIAKNADEAGAGGKKFRDQFIDMMKLDKVSKRAMLGLINDMQSYDDAYKMLTSEEMKGRVEELYDTFRNTPEANINKMKAALEVLQTQFVGGLAPAITEVTLSMKELLMVSEINDIIPDPNAEKWHITTETSHAVDNCEIIIVTVPTPVTSVATTPAFDTLLDTAVLAEASKP